MVLTFSNCLNHLNEEITVNPGHCIASTSHPTTCTDSSQSTAFDRFGFGLCAPAVPSSTVKFTDENPWVQKNVIESGNSLATSTREVHGGKRSYNHKWTASEMKEYAERNQETSIANALHAVKLALFRQINFGIADRFGISPDMVLFGGIPLKNCMSPGFATINEGVTTPELARG